MLDEEKRKKLLNDVRIAAKNNNKPWKKVYDYDIEPDNGFFANLVKIQIKLDDVDSVIYKLAVSLICCVLVCAACAGMMLIKIAITFEEPSMLWVILIGAGALGFIASIVGMVV